jgi:hypothetical protein
MCTLTYLPLENEQYILTSNRDESPSRAEAEFPAYKHIENKNIIFPKDPQAGGTWIATSDNGITVCLLNGADKAHEMNPPYKISRGLVLLEAIECIKPDEFFKNYDFSGIEPFTMVVLFHNPILKVIEFKWNGVETSLNELAVDQPHIWVSAQLYSAEAIQNRQNWFHNWLETHDDFTVEGILAFHETAGNGDKENDMVMDRGIVKTVSITSVISQVGILRVLHKDLGSNREKELCLTQNVNQEFSNHSL